MVEGLAAFFDGATGLAVVVAPPQEAICMPNTRRGAASRAAASFPLIMLFITK